jgi:hypothetical protein
VFPIAAVPKFTLVGDTDIAGCPAVAPLPVNGIVETVGLVFAAMEIVPNIAAVVVGANFAVKVVLCPAATRIGNTNPDTENPDPVAAN